MFDSYVNARTEKPGRWRGIATTASVITHLAVGLGLVIYSFWSIDKLEAKYVPVTFNGAAPPPPAPAPAPPPAMKGGGTTNKTRPTKPRVPKDIVQPVNVEKKVVEDEPEADVTGPGDPDGDPNGDPNGVPGGTGNTPGGTGNTPGGTGTEVIPQVTKPVVVPAHLVEGQMIAGNKQITLPDGVKQVMSAQGLKKTTGVVKLCVSDGGAPTAIDLVKSTGFGDADQKILREMQSWRYRAYRVNGRAVPFCTSIIFNYVLY